MKSPYGVTLDGGASVCIVAGEDRLIKLVFTDNDSGEPLDMTGMALTAFLPGNDNRAIVRTDSNRPISLQSVRYFDGQSPASFSTLGGHGLCVGDTLGVGGNQTTLDQVLVGLAPQTPIGTPVVVHAVLDAMSFELSVGGVAYQPNLPDNTALPALMYPGDIAYTRQGCGVCTLGLDAHVTASLMLGCGQDIDLQCLLGDKMRIVVLNNVLDVGAPLGP